MRLHHERSGQDVDVPDAAVAEVVMRENERLRADLERFADWVERDRREPDKLLCHVASMRRSAFDASSDQRATLDEPGKPGEGRNDG